MIESSLHRSEPVLLPGRPFGRQVRSVIGYALLTALMIVTPMLVFVPAALLHCAIRNGRRAAWAVLVLSLAIASLYAAAVPGAQPDAQKMAWSFLLGVGLAITLPAMAAIPMVERGEKFGRVLVFLLAGAMVGLALTETASQLLMSFSPYAAQLAQAKESSKELAQMFRGLGMPAESLRAAEQQMNQSTLVLPAVMLINACLVFILSLLMLGRLKAWREFAARRVEAGKADVYLFRNFSLPDWLLFAFVAGGLTPLITGLMQKITANMLAVVAFLYVMQGLAVFRSMLLSIGAGIIGTVFGWAMLAITFPFSLLAIGVTGLFDSFFDFRHYKKRKDDSHESHSD
jgi:MFS family permease